MVKKNGTMKILWRHKMVSFNENENNLMKMEKI